MKATAEAEPAAGHTPILTDGGPRPQPLGRPVAFGPCDADSIRVCDHHVVEHGRNDILVTLRTGGWGWMSQEGIELLHSLHGLTPQQAAGKTGLRWEQLRGGLDDPLAWGLLELPGMHKAAARSCQRKTQFSLLVLKASARCNMRCAYCYDPGGDGGVTVDTAQCREAICRAIDYSTAGLRVVFHGGEPFLALDMMREVCAFARTHAEGRGKELRFSVQTNGTLFSADALAFVDEHAVGVGISLDGAGALNGLRVDGSGRDTTRRVWEGIRKLQDRGRQANIITVVTSQNAHALCEIALQFQAQSIASLKFSPFVRQRHHGEAARRLTPDPGEIIRSLKGIIDAIADGAITTLLVEEVCELAASCLTGRQWSVCRPSGPCGAGRDMLAIYGDEVFACDCLVHEAFRLGRVSAVSSFAEFEDAPALRLLAARSAAGLTPCSECALAALCGGTLGCRAFWRNGNLLTVEADACRVSQEVLPYLLLRLTDSRRLVEYVLAWDRLANGRKAEDQPTPAPPSQERSRGANRRNQTPA